MSWRCIPARRLRIAVLSVALAGILAGCVEPRPPAPAEIDRGLVVLLPGIEGSRTHLGGMVAGLRDAGVDWGLDVIPWNEWTTNSLNNLVNLPANRERARKIAERLAEYHKTHPQKPVILIGYSGGGGLAVLTAEALPPDVMIDRLILIGAAVAPDHDLKPILTHCRGGLVNFYSEQDWLVLDLGTNLFGTIDRENTPAAGKVGLLDAEGRLLSSECIVQIPWRPEWARYGHDGGHLGWLSREWAKAVLAPVIKESAAGAEGKP